MRCQYHTDREERFAAWEEKRNNKDSAPMEICNVVVLAGHQDHFSSEAETQTRYRGSSQSSGPRPSLKREIVWKLTTH